MKTLKEIVNEARQVEYRVSLIDVYDNHQLPVSATILIDKVYQNQFEDWLEEQQDNIFAHAEGGSVEY